MRTEKDSGRGRLDRVVGNGCTRTSGNLKTITNVGDAIISKLDVAAEFGVKARSRLWGVRSNIVLDQNIARTLYVYAVVVPVIDAVAGDLGSAGVLDVQAVTVIAGIGDAVVLNYRRGCVDHGDGVAVAAIVSFACSRAFNHAVLDHEALDSFAIANPTAATASR